MNRRTFLGTAAAAGGLGFAPLPVPIIDAHTHFFDPRRPEGVTWPTKDMSIYRPVLPNEFVALTKPFGVRGTIMVEVSERIEDHDWALALAAENPVIVAYLGRLTPGQPDFPTLLDHYRKNPLFRGIRTFFGAIGEGLNQPRFIEDLKRMADAGLEIDVAGAPQMLPKATLDLAKLSQRIPDLRMVINHLPMPKPDTPEGLSILSQGMKELKQCPLVYAKVSEVIRSVGGVVHQDLAFWKGSLDEVYALFGPDRVIYGSNWPSCLAVTEYEPVIGLVKEYFKSKGTEVSEKYFWKNSAAAYRWVRRKSSQPG
jgi:L-fuconolactonase